jgi:HD superfamily phosphohydrolase
VSLLELRLENPICSLAERIDEWASGILADYVTDHPTNPNRHIKDIHDTVWGTIFLERWELFCLDSPLLQRLRYIRQLGVAHFLFPSTGYSRFEHTLGTVEQADRIFRSLSAAGGDPPTAMKEDDFRYALRLAALFHDVGHCAFSHVTEKFYRLHPEVAAAAEAVGDYYDREVSSSELISILIVSSPAVRALLRIADPGIRQFPRGDELVDFMCACIAGSITQTFPNAFVAQILNGTIDCDKLDYLARDSRMAGTPVMLDAQRLQAKLRVVPELDQTRNALTHTLAIDVSGARALEEMLASRVFLYDKLYFHHKVQAAEELVRQALRDIEGTVPAVRDPAFLLRFSDEQLLDLTDPGFRRSEESITRAARLLERVRNRRLPRRAFSFAPRFVLPTPDLILRLREASGRRGRGLVETERGLSDLEYEEARLTLAREVQVRAAELGDYNAETYVAWPKATSVVGGGDISAVDADGAVWPADVMFAANKWVDAYSTSKQTGYVFANRPSPRIFLAAERALGDRGIWGSERALTFSKVKRSNVDRERERIARDFSEDEAWIRHRLAPTWIDERTAKERIAALSDRYAPALGASGIPSRQWISAWLWQFPDSDLQESALRVAEHFHIYGRNERAALFQRHIAEAGELGAWCYFSAPEGRRTKSAEMLGYYLKDLGQKHPQTRKLTEYSADELREQGQVRFFDDCSCTGAQAVSLIASWFGRNDLVRSPRDAAAPLPSDLQAVLRTVPIHLFFCVSRRSAVDAIRDLGATLGLDLHIYIGEDFETQMYTLDGVEFATPASKRRIWNFLQERGERLLDHRREDPENPWTLEQVKSFALGYEGSAALFGFEYSVASAIVTAVWEGRYDGPDPWLPLVPRYPSVASKYFNFTPIPGTEAPEPVPLDPASDI